MQDSGSDSLILPLNDTKFKLSGLFGFGIKNKRLWSDIRL